MTSEVRHTPGPWLLEIDEKNALAIIVGPRRDANTRLSDGLGTIVAIECETDDAARFSPMSEEQLANANLIAAAPTMYEAAQGVLDWVLYALSNPVEFDSHGVRNLTGPAFDKLEAALLAAQPSHPGNGVES